MEDLLVVGRLAALEATAAALVVAPVVVTIVAREVNDISGEINSDGGEGRSITRGTSSCSG